MDLIGIVKAYPLRAVGWGIGYVGLLLFMAWLSVGGCSDDVIKAGDCTVAWMRGNPFWASFYSNLMSTFVGAGLGLGAALWLNSKTEAERRHSEAEAEARRRDLESKREAQRRQDERDAEERQRQLREADAAQQRNAERAAELTRRVAVLRLIAHELGRIQEMLRNAVPRLSQRQTSRIVISAEAWDAISGQILPGLMESEEGINLAKRLTTFYAYLKTNLGTLEGVRELVIARGPTMDPNSPLLRTLEGMAVIIGDAAVELDVQKREIDEVIARYQEEAASLAPPAAEPESPGQTAGLLTMGKQRRSVQLGIRVRSG